MCSLFRQEVGEFPKDGPGIQKAAPVGAQVSFVDNHCSLELLSADGIKPGHPPQRDGADISDLSNISRRWFDSSRKRHRPLTTSSRSQVYVSLFIIHLMPNKWSFGHLLLFQNELIVLRQHMVSLMPSRCFSSASSSEKNFSFPHLHGRFVVELRMPAIPCPMFFRIGLVIQVRLDLLLLELLTDVLGQLDEILDLMKHRETRTLLHCIKFILSHPSSYADHAA